MRVHDDCARGLIRSFYHTAALAVKAGAEDHKACLRQLRQALDQVPAQHEIETARSDPAIDAICTRIAKAERLASRAEYCAERRAR